MKLALQHSLTNLTSLTSCAPVTNRFKKRDGEESLNRGSLILEVFFQHFIWALSSKTRKSRPC